MSYSLDDFCADVRAILSANDNHQGRDSIRQKLELLLQDSAFCAAHVGPGNSAGVSQIFQDPDLHFCVLAYNMAGSRKSPPHDHGNSWAVYGQVAGYTDMTIWSTGEGTDGENQDDGKVEPVRAFRLDPGQAGLFDVHEIHSIEYPDQAKFVRVTGVDMSQESRRVYDVATGTVRVIEHVGTGSVR